MPVPSPIPLHGLKGNDAYAGTGFLVADEENTWLVTCVHIITGLLHNTLAIELFAGGRLEVVGKPISIQLFEGATQRFTAVNNTTTGRLADVMAIKLKQAEIDALASYGSYELSSVVAPELGEKVSAVGFPGLGQTLISSTTMNAEIVEIEGLTAKLSQSSAQGLSGSALVGSAGLIGIVYGDMGEPSRPENGVAVLFDVVGPSLFK